MADQATGGDKAAAEGDGDNFGGLKVVPENGEAGIDDSGEDGADTDILGKKQADLTVEDLSGDARHPDVE